MQFSISGQHISIGASLETYVKDKTNGAVLKYFENAPSSNIHFSKDSYQFVCDIIVNEGTGRHITIKSKATSDEIYNAFDLALAKLEKQLRKYKSKLKDRSAKIKSSEAINKAIKYVIDSSTPSHEEETDIDNPIIIAEKEVKLSKLSVGEAVMKMDLENLPALMFLNTKNDRINIVYYRKDGNISWVDSDS
jgi:ribosomal subunit interface protein